VQKPEDISQATWPRRIFLYPSSSKIGNPYFRQILKLFSCQRNITYSHGTRISLEKQFTFSSFLFNLVSFCGFYVPQVILLKLAKPLKQIINFSSLYKEGYL
jgi:hypothetical protein